MSNKKSLPPISNVLMMDPMNASDLFVDFTKGASSDMQSGATLSELMGAIQKGIEDGGGGGTITDASDLTVEFTEGESGTMVSGSTVAQLMGAIQKALADASGGGSDIPVSTSYDDQHNVGILTGIGWNSLDQKFYIKYHETASDTDKYYTISLKQDLGSSIIKFNNNNYLTVSRTLDSDTNSYIFSANSALQNITFLNYNLYKLTIYDEDLRVCYNTVIDRKILTENPSNNFNIDLSIPYWNKNYNITLSFYKQGFYWYVDIIGSDPNTADSKNFMARVTLEYLTSLRSL